MTLQDSPLFSVVVCTRNRSDLLARALDGLRVQELKTSEYEILVVDNASTDDTRSVVEARAGETPDMRYLMETEVGLSAARNRGWRAARGRYVAYTDDDCKIPPDWLPAARKIVEARQPDVFGGPYYAFYDHPKPPWFRDEYGSRALSSEARRLRPDELLVGGNLFIRRDVLEAVGGFAVSLGMRGRRIAYGEDPAVQHEIRRRFPHAVFYYDPDLLVYHLVRVEKLSLRWLTQSFFAKGRDVQASVPDPVPDRGRLDLAFDAMRTGLAFTRDFATGLVSRDRHRYPFFANYYYEHLSQYLRRLGRLYWLFTETGRKDEAP